METETVINISDKASLFSGNKGEIGRLKRLGIPIVKRNDYGAWFDLTGVILSVKINKKRGNGMKEMELKMYLDPTEEAEVHDISEPTHNGQTVT